MIDGCCGRAKVGHTRMDSCHARHSSIRYNVRRTGRRGRPWLDWTSALEDIIRTLLLIDTQAGPGQPGRPPLLISCLGSKMRDRLDEDGCPSFSRGLVRPTGLCMELMKYCTLYTHADLAKIGQRIGPDGRESQQGGSQGRRGYGVKVPVPRLQRGC